jgi:NAD(P)-dependent dehydrogenase (short-subunit alcohol dehydrogenase family)
MMTPRHPIMPTPSARSQTALITGATSGIGRACAEALAAAGFKTILCGRDSSRLGAFVAEIHFEPRDHADAIAGDLLDQTTLESVASRVRELGGLDILIHAAGIHHLGTVEETPIEELDRQLGVNLRAPFQLTKLLLPWLVARQGQIVFVNSSAVQNPAPGVAAYAASKAALKAFADVLRAEVNAAGVRVLSVFPGRTATPMQAAILAAEGRPYDPETLLAPGDVAATILQALQAPRGAEITDIFMRPMRPLRPATVR